MIKTHKINHTIIPPTFSFMKALNKYSAQNQTKSFTTTHAHVTSILKGDRCRWKLG